MNDLTHGIEELRLRKKHSKGLNDSTNQERRKGILDFISKKLVDLINDDAKKGAGIPAREREKEERTERTIEEEPAAIEEACDVQCVQHFQPVLGYTLPSVDICPQYNRDIMDYIYLNEAEIPDDFLSKHPSGLSVKNRARVVNYIAEMHADSTLPLESFFLAVWLMDTYINKFSTKDKRELELLSLTSLRLAVKFEQQRGYDLHAYADHPKRDVDLMEQKVFRTSGMFLGRSTIIHFVRILAPSVMRGEDSRGWLMAKFLAQMATTDDRLARKKPSLVGAAVVRLIALLKDRRWSESLTQHTQYSATELNDTTQLLFDVVFKCLRKPKPTAIVAAYNKLSSNLSVTVFNKMMSVSGPSAARREDPSSTS